MAANASLKQKSLSALIWSGVDVFMRQGLKLAISMVLARLLTPEEFGTIALLYLFMGVASTFIDGGFSSALVQRQNLTRTDESTVFWFNLLMAAACTALLWLAAPLIADFYALPILVPLTRILSLSIFVNALGSVQNTLFCKRLDFKTPMKIAVASNVFSGAAAIWLALHGYGPAALAWQIVLGSTINTILLWLRSRWRPQWVFSVDSVRKLFRFGGYLMVASLLDTVYTQMYSLLLGKFYGIRELGFFTRAENAKQIPVEAISTMLAKVAFPIFSQAADDKQKLRRGAQMAVRGIMLINIPLMLGLSATAEPVLAVLYGEQWLSAAPLLQILCLSGLWWPMHVINLNILKAQGYSNLFFRLEVIKKTLGTCMLIAAIPYGALGIAGGQAIFSVIAFLINAYYTRKFLDYGPLKQIRDFLPVLLVAVLMSMAVHELHHYDLKSNGQLLGLQIAIGGILFLLTCQLFKVRAFTELRDMLQKRSRNPDTLRTKR